MIVQAAVDESGGVSVSIDSDGDQGEFYSTDVLDDMLTRAGQQAIALWFATRADADDDATDTAA